MNKYKELNELYIKIKSQDVEKQNIKHITSHRYNKNKKGSPTLSHQHHKIPDKHLKMISLFNFKTNLKNKIKIPLLNYFQKSNPLPNHI